MGPSQQASRVIPMRALLPARLCRHGSLYAPGISGKQSRNDRGAGLCLSASYCVYELRWQLRRHASEHCLLNSLSGSSTSVVDHAFQQGLGGGGGLCSGIILTSCARRLTVSGQQVLIGAWGGEGSTTGISTG
jgi:hypothetical protein